jgi:hypothetical protein
MQAELQGEEYEEEKGQAHNIGPTAHKMETSGLKMVEQQDFSGSYSHPYFKPIEKG